MITDLKYQVNLSFEKLYLASHFKLIIDIFSLNFTMMLFCSIKFIH